MIKLLKLCCLTLLLWVVVLAVMLAYSSWQRRVALNAFYAVRDNTYNLQEEWNELIVEQSTFVTLERVEKIAIHQLNMNSPSMLDLKQVSP